MIKFMMIALLLISCGVSGKKLGQNKEFSQVQLSEDLQQLTESLQKFHSGLYWYQSQREFEEFINLTQQSIEDGQELLEFYKKISWLISKIGCGHTRARLPKNRRKQFLDSTYYLPFGLTVVDDKLLANSDDINSISGGSVILSIDGNSSQKMLDEFRDIISSDGFNTTGKDYAISKHFAILYAMNFMTNDGHSLVKYSDPGYGRVFEKRIELIPYEELGYTSNTQPLLSLKDLEDTDTKLLTIKTFSKGYLSSNGFDYYDFMKETFQKLRADKVENLVIDVRGNGGGDDNFGATLVSYITNQPFGYFDTIEVTQAYQGWGRVIETDGGKRLMVSHNDLSEHQSQRHYFNGNTFILTDGGSFSTTADFVSISKEIGAAKIIGIETGGGACGNTSGISERITLKNTRISVNIPMWNYHSSIDKNTRCGYGVFPDYEVFDLPYTDKDEVMEMALELIKTIENKKMD